MKDELKVALDGIKAECVAWVSRLNEGGRYVEANYLQSLLQQCDNIDRKIDSTWPTEASPPATPDTAAVPPIVQ